MTLSLDPPLNFTLGTGFAQIPHSRLSSMHMSHAWCMRITPFLVGGQLCETPNSAVLNKQLIQTILVILASWPQPPPHLLNVTMMGRLGTSKLIVNCLWSTLQPFHSPAVLDIHSIWWVGSFTRVSNRPPPPLKIIFLCLMVFTGSRLPQFVCAKP